MPFATPSEATSQVHDLRDLLDVLEARGKLLRFDEAMCKDTEAMPLFRLQLCGVPEAERRVMLFEHVVGAAGQRYGMALLAGVYGASADILRIGLGCEQRTDVLQRVARAIAEPVTPELIRPELRASAPVHEVVHTGRDLHAVGLDALPAPVEEPGFSQIIRTGMPMITKDPETGVRNVGTYNAFIRDRTRMVAGISEVHDARRHHWATARRRGEDLPVAIVVGVTPTTMLMSSMGVPYGVDELALAGAFDGRAVELVPCKTVPLEVPANAEMVIEGLLSTSVLEPRLGFSEYPGYINVAEDPQPVLHVTAITHRADAMFTPMLVGFPPSDTNTVWSLANAAHLYHQLRHVAGFPLVDVEFPQAGAGNDICLLRVERDTAIDIVELLQSAADLHRMGKWFIAVDDDVDLADWSSVCWALSYRVAPERDIRVVEGRVAALDPAELPFAGDLGRRPTRVLIDATMKHAYAPVALPAKRYMVAAIERWNRRSDVPPLRIGGPWHSTATPSWSAADEHLAQLIVDGDYRAVGRITAGRQTPVE
jgi:UbiD family decarboxylase